MSQRVMSIEEVRDEVPDLDQEIFGLEELADDDLVVFFDEETAFDVLDLNEQAEDVVGVVVMGNLIVEEDIISLDDEAAFLYVDGDIVAGAIYARGAEISATGDIVARDLVYGEGEEGAVRSGGAIRAPWVISNEHELEAASGIDGQEVDVLTGEGVSEEYLDQEGEVDVERLLEDILSGAITR